MTAGKGIAGPGPKKTPPPPIELEMRRIGQLLPQDQQKDLRKELRERSKELRPVMRELFQVRRELSALLTAEVIDRAALKAALERQDALWTQTQMPIRAIFLDVIAGLDLETRQKIAREFRTGKKAGNRRRLPVHRRSGPGGDQENRKENRQSPPPGL